MIDLTIFAEWKAVAGHHGIVADLHLRELFAANPGRAEAMTVDAGDLVVDYSKNRITDETMSLSDALAERAELPERIARHVRAASTSTAPKTEPCSTPRLRAPPTR